MDDKAKNLVSQLLAASERLSSLLSKDNEPSHDKIAALGVEVELAFEALLSAKFSKPEDHLTRVRHLVSYIKQSSKLDGIREKAIDQILDDTLALVGERRRTVNRTSRTPTELKDQYGNMIELCYRSKTSSRLSEFDIRELAANAKTRNKKRSITGMLAYDQTNEHLFQILEGREDVIQDLMSSIVKDERHHDIELRFQGNISERNFGPWSMFVTTTFEMQKEINNVVQVDEWLETKIPNKPKPRGSIGRTWMTDSLKKVYVNSV